MGEVRIATVARAGYRAITVDGRVLGAGELVASTRVTWNGPGNAWDAVITLTVAHPDGHQDAGTPVTLRSSDPAIMNAARGAYAEYAAWCEALRTLADGVPAPAARLEVGMPVLYSRRFRHFPGYGWDARTGVVVRAARSLTLAECDACQDGLTKRGRAWVDTSGEQECPSTHTNRHVPATGSEVSGPAVFIGETVSDSEPDVFIIGHQLPDDGTAGITGVWVTTDETVDYFGRRYASRNAIMDATEIAERLEWSGFGMAIDAGTGEPVDAEEEDGEFPGSLRDYAYNLARTEAIMSAINEVRPGAGALELGTVVFDAATPGVAEVVANLTGCDAATFETRILAIEHTHELYLLTEEFDVPEEFAAEILREIHKASEGAGAGEFNGRDVSLAIKAAGYGKCIDCDGFMTDAATLPEEPVCQSCETTYAKHGEQCRCFAEMIETARMRGTILSRADFERLDETRCPMAPAYGTVEGGPDPDGAVWTRVTVADSLPVVTGEEMRAILANHRQRRNYVGAYSPDDGAGCESVVFTADGQPSITYTRPRG